MELSTSRPAEPILLSLEQSVPGGNEGGWVESTDDDEQQKVEAHHDGEVMSEKPRGAAGMSEEENNYCNYKGWKRSQFFFGRQSEKTTLSCHYTVIMFLNKLIIINY